MKIPATSAKREIFTTRNYLKFYLKNGIIATLANTLKCWKGSFFITKIYELLK